MEKLTLTRKEAAAILGISTATVTQWVKSGRLRAIKISKKEKSRYLFTLEDCKAALRYDQEDQPPMKASYLPLLTQSTVPLTPSHTKGKDVSKQLAEMLKIRDSKAKRGDSAR